MFSLNDKNKYNVVKDFYIEEQKLEVVELVHIKTGANLVLLICDDENKVFNIAFKTPVSNGKGTPHILEHSVLCGSKKYNVKDPFIELAKGSMNTFLNAMTFPDKTCYPVASANLKDFHNLVDVYLDAVFYPNAVKDDKIFKQEGWHYEIDNKDDDLKVNGVVFNEMRGVYSDPDSILESAILENIFANTNYAYESGGNPQEIYNLTFDEFREFHKKYYSPSNAIIYLYGKLDYNYELEYLDREYLQNFDKIDVNAEFKTAKNDTTFKEQINYYNIDTVENSDKAYLAYTFSLGSEKASLKSLVLQIIDYVLFSSDSAILKEKFLNEGYGEHVYSRYEMELKEEMYSIIAQNISESKKDKFVKFFDDEIKRIISEGLDVDKFKSGINSLYFSFAESEFSNLPRGIALSLASLDTNLYGKGSATYLQYEKEFKIINAEDLNDSNNIFIRTLKEIFIDNNHKCINILRPKLNYSDEKEKILKDELLKRKNSFTSEELDKIISEMNELKNYQKSKDTDDDLKCIPMISISDIERDKKTIDYDLEVNENVETIISYKNDRDIVYMGLKFDISDLSKEEIYLFSLVNNIISKVDLVSESFHDFNNFIDINTGGLSIGIDVTDDKAFFSFSIKAKKENVRYAFDIFYKLFSETQFVDQKRIGILLNENRQSSLLTILSSGHGATIFRSKSTFDFSSNIVDKVSEQGIGHYKFISSMCDYYLKNFDIVNDSLDLVFKKLHRRKMYFTICTDKKYHDDVINEFKIFSDKIIKNKMKHIYTEVDEKRLKSNIDTMNKSINFDSLDKKVKSEAIITPNDINFCALSGKFDSKAYSGRLSVIKTLFNYEYLWTNIRVLGGAYGCMSTFSRNGVYSLCSYRDPNVSNTNKIYYGVPKFLSNFSEASEINKYIIGSMRRYDNPMSIVDNHKRNLVAFFNNETDETYNRLRHEVLDTKLKDIQETSKIFDDIKNADKCALVSASKIDEAKSEYDDVWTLTE